VHLLRILWRIVRFFLRLVGYLIVLAVMLFGLNGSTLPIGVQWNAVALLARDEQFDYVAWELDALSIKLNQTLYGLHPFMNEADRSQNVRDFIALLAQAQRVEGQINTIFTDPNVVDPEVASAELRAERDRLRAELGSRQPLAESILEGQVATILVEQGFGLGGQLLPPISMHFTQVPLLLIVSPRDTIRFDISINLNPMPVDEQASLETLIDKQEDVASLIVPLGGIALYPAMVLETTSIPNAVDTIAHEWLHHYLFAFPLGLSYDFAGEARIINETTAHLFGREITPLVMRRYYPELAPPPPPPDDTDGSRTAPPLRVTPEPPAFDFGAEMNETRVTVDELLAEGNVEEAEAYMEERRSLFVEYGYGIRKLNQAYFAFYGGYQSGDPGVGGEDPIGPAVQAILDASPSIYDWVLSMRDITTRDELLAVSRGVVR
jgi:hypothetical protein